MTHPPNRPLPFRQAQGPELAEGQHRLRVACALGFILASITPAFSASSPVEPPQLWPLVVTAVRPEYPYAAMRSNFHGHGVLVGEVDFRTGGYFCQNGEEHQQHYPRSGSARWLSTVEVQAKDASKVPGADRFHDGPRSLTSHFA
jgi:hypothetical protein